MMLRLKNNARVGLLAKLGKRFDPKLATQVALAEPRIERALYQRCLNAIYVLWGNRVAEALDGQRTDAKAPRGPIPRAPQVLLDIDWDTLIDQSGLKGVLNKIANSMHGRNTAYFEKILRTNPPEVGDIAKRIADFRKANIELVKNAGHKMVSDLNETLSDANARGMRHEEIAKVIKAKTKVSEKRAKLIARDQTLKYNASVHQAQAQAAGIEEYTWSDSGDGAVRPMHHKLNGKRFRYDDPPVTNEEGDRNNPGEDYNCRCNAIPVIKLFEGLEEWDTTTGTLADVDAPAAAPTPQKAPKTRTTAPAVADDLVEVVPEGRSWVLGTTPEANKIRQPAAEHPLQSFVNEQGLQQSTYLRSGMRDLTQHRAAYAGASLEEAQQIAQGQLPARNTHKFFEPVRVAIEPDRGTKRVVLQDGRHRMTAAKEAGAKTISALIVEYGPRGGILRKFRGPVRI